MMASQRVQYLIRVLPRWSCCSAFRKVSDEFAVPLCLGHHRAVHRSRDERAWWRQAGIDPIKVARRLWKKRPTEWTREGLKNQHYFGRMALRPHGAAAASEPRATTKPQEDPRVPGLPE
jgi:hypothetical protein